MALLMKTKLEQILERNLKGREVAVWGTPTRLLKRALRSYNYSITDKVYSSRYYVVTVSDDDLDDFLLDEQSKSFKYADDYVGFTDIGGELPFEWECFGVKIGRQTYFGDGFIWGCKDGYIKSIGHFTSINSSADMGVNHQLNMTFVSDDIELLFSDEIKKKFQELLDNDPGCPYARNKEPITIGNDVYIGANVFINPSKVTNIGDGAIIGSGAVVLEDVPPYAVVVGVPAKIKRYRYSPEMIETLLKVKWWNWSTEEINANIDELISPELFMKKFGNM